MRFPLGFRTRAAVATLAALSAAFVWHAAQAQTPPLTVVRAVGPPNDGYKAVYYGVKSGIFRKYGLDVQTLLVPVPTDRKIQESIADSEAQSRSEARALRKQAEQELEMPVQVNTLAAAQTADDLRAIYELLNPHGIARARNFRELKRR